MDNIKKLSSEEIHVYKLVEPMFNWSRGEIFSFNLEWGIWTRKSTGEEFTYRGSIREGEINYLLTYLTHLSTFLERIE